MANHPYPFLSGALLLIYSGLFYIDKLDETIHLSLGCLVYLNFNHFSSIITVNFMQQWHSRESDLGLHCLTMFS